jgi:hypothetical protein
MRQTLNVIYDYRQNVLFRLSPSIRIGDSKNLNYRIRERILGRTDDNILLDIASSLILDQLFMHVRLLNKAKSIDENSDVFNELKKNSIFSNLIEIVRDRGIPNNTLNSILQPCIPQGFKLKTKLVNPSYKNNERIILENRWIRLTIDYHVGLETQIRKFGRKYYPLVGDIPIESSQMDKAYELFQMEHLRLITLNYNVELRLKMGRVFFALITFIRGKFRTENLEFVKQLESIYEFLENNFHGSINYDLVEEHSNASDKYLLDTLKKVNDRLAEAQKSTKEKI